VSEHDPQPQSAPQSAPAVPSPGYETRDTNVGAVALIGVSLLGLVIGAMVLVYVIVIAMTGRDTGIAESIEARPPTMFDDALQSNQELLRKRQEAVHRNVLKTYGWIDREEQRVRIPIDRAIAIVSEHGVLPSFAAKETDDVRP
jgi:hypothetical protein